MSRLNRRAAALAAALALSAACARTEPNARLLTIATTTSVANSGLLDALASAYEEESGVAVRSHLVGSGRALDMLAAGTVALVISHAPEAEAARLTQHPHWRYRKFMYNDFVLVGPSSDPAGVRRATRIEDAMRRIAESGARFLSRGDRSGTHERERLLWSLAGTKPPGDRRVVAGSGMGATLRIAGRTGGYTLTDRATYAQHASSFALTIVFEGGAAMLNTYAAVWDPRPAGGDEGERFARWLSDGTGRDAIADFSVGGRLGAFVPWPEGRGRSSPLDLPVGQ